MEKTKSELIDELIVTNIKIFFLIEKIQDGKANMDEAQKVQSLNKQRSELMNALNKEYGERERVKV